MRKIRVKSLILRIKCNYATFKLKRGVKESCSEKPMRLNPEQRRLIGVSIKVGIKINLLAEAFSCSRQTIWYWSVQDLRTRFDISKNYDGKITIDVEIAIINMRLKFKWGTGRIQNGLISLPEFQQAEIEVCVKNFNLSRQAINCVLKKHKLNGYYRRKNKSWKFF